MSSLIPDGRPNIAAQEALPDVTTLDLLAISPTKPDLEAKARPEWILGKLIPEDDLARFVSCGDKGVIARVSDIYRDAINYPMMCCNPYKDKRSGEVAYRRFLITQFDSRGLDRQATRIAGLMDRGFQLCLICFDAVKELSAWWYCADKSRDEQVDFFSQAMELGADFGFWNKAALTRTPDAQRMTQSNVEARHALKNAGLTKMVGLEGVMPNWSRRQVVFYLDSPKATASSGNGALPDVPEKGRRV